jgi:hypothetical protein
MRKKPFIVRVKHTYYTEHLVKAYGVNDAMDADIDTWDRPVYESDVDDEVVDAWPDTCDT